MDTNEKLYIVSDLTACAFMLILLMTTRLQNRSELKIPTKGAFLLAAGILIRVCARIGFIGSAQFLFTTYHSAAKIIIGIVTSVSFILFFISIVYYFTLMLTEDFFSGDGRKIKIRILINSIFVITVCSIYIYDGDLRLLSAALLIELTAGCLFCMFSRKRIISINLMLWPALIPITFFAIVLITDRMRLTGMAMALMYIAYYVNSYILINRKLRENEAEIAKARVSLLSEQISSHFIFNSLQVIHGLIGTDPDKAENAVEAFSDYLRGDLEGMTLNDMVYFSRELEYVKAYLSLEQMTGKEFEVIYDLKVTDFMLPPLVLQPVVENAVRYGTGNKGDKIFIETESLPDSIQIRVKNNGYGKNYRKANGFKTKSIGLENVRSRLKLLCGGSLDLDITDEITTATIVLYKNSKHNI